MVAGKGTASGGSWDGVGLGREKRRKVVANARAVHIRLLLARTFQ
jgi:hypothetical protein